MEIFSPTAINFKVISPQIILIFTFLMILLIDLFSDKNKKEHLALLSVFGLATAGYCVIRLWNTKVWVFDEMLVIDNFALIFNLIFIVSAALTILLSVNYIKQKDINLGEYYAIVLASVFGAMLMASAGNLLIVFLGVEILSISVYVLVGIDRKCVRSGEAALKYLLLGAFASGILLYGIALIYGTTGSTNLKKISQVLFQNTEHRTQNTDSQFRGTEAQRHKGTEPSAGRDAQFGRLYSNHQITKSSNPHSALRTPHSIILVLGMVLILIGFAFKIALVPFHMWSPDVYEGAPTPITAFMATAVKAAGFSAFVRVFIYSFPALKDHWLPILWTLSVLAMFIGNIIAIPQENIKRMLAYSSIAHTGYILIIFVDGSIFANASMLYYLIAYLFMTIGAFGVIIALETPKTLCEVCTYDTPSTKIATDELANGEWRVASGTSNNPQPTTNNHNNSAIRNSQSTIATSHQPSAISSQPSYTYISDFTGLGFKKPFLAAMMTIFMFSLAGLPPTAGFFAKLYIFLSAVKSGYTGLIILAVISAVISVYFYLKVTVLMYMHKQEASAENEKRAPGFSLQPSAFSLQPSNNQQLTTNNRIYCPVVILVVIVACLVVLFLGLSHAAIFDYLKEAAKSIL